jgi:pimeloyl-ACP methyl ester carboxylesterase
MVARQEQPGFAAPAAEVVGTGPRVVLVHGSVINAKRQWVLQRELASSFTLVLANRRGYPPNPPLDYLDFEDQADDVAALLEDGSHLVGFSYGGVIALLTAGRRPEAIRSLTVIEPPALRVARGHPDVDRLALDLSALFWCGPRDVRPFLEEFLQLMGGKFTLPRTLPPDLEQGARALMVERPPWDARVALETIARAPFPKLVVSGAHNPALDAVCDALEQQLGAERTIIPGEGHNIPQAGIRFNDTLVAFLERAEQQRWISVERSR